MNDRRRQTAIHEAGHVVAAYCLGMDQNDGPVTIEPDPEKGSLGHYHSDSDSEFFDSQDEGEAAVVIMMCGFEAVERYCGTSGYEGASGDEAKAKSLLQYLPSGIEQELQLRAHNLVRDAGNMIIGLADALMEENTLSAEDTSVILSAIEGGIDWRQSLVEYRALSRLREDTAD